MHSKSIKKIVASAMVLSLCLGVGTQTINRPIVVQADDLYNDDREIFKGNLSITGKTTQFGKLAVTLPIPAGVRVNDIGIDNEPHDNIDETIVGRNIVIYGLRPGITYRNLRLTLEDVNGTDYVYILNPFTVEGNTQPPSSGGQVNIPTQANKPAIQDYLKAVYKNIFNRQVDQQGLDFWTNQLASGRVDLEGFFQRLLVEREFLSVAPTVEDKIKKLYEGIFQRQPDQEGFRYWVNQYKLELRDERNERKALEDIIDKMTEGPEYQGILNRLGLFDN